MKKIGIIQLLILMSVLSTFGPKPKLIGSQTPQGLAKVTVSRQSGGSIQQLGSLAQRINKGSSLNREWIAVHDQTMPVEFVGTPGITVSARGYFTEFTIEARESLTAIQVRFLIFDIWGNLIRALVQTEITDIQGRKDFSAGWYPFPEEEIPEYYASLAFISKVRTQAREGVGPRILEANLTPVIEEARKCSKKFSLEDIEPKPDKK